MEWHIKGRDVERHLSRAEHVKKAKVVKQCQPMTSFCTTDDDNDKVTSAEVLFTSFILEHNLPFESASHAAPLFRKMFPDSKIAKKYGCAATKTAAIVNYALAPEMLRPVVEYMRKEPFSLAIDGSSDTGTESMYPLVVRIFDINTSTVGTKFWHMCLVSDSSAKGIFEQASKAFELYSIPWENAVGLSLDNASVNMGKHNGLYTHFKAQNDAIYTAGCPCHMIHNTAGHAEKVFAQTTGFVVSDVLVDVYYYFEKSTKRQASLKDFCSFCDQDYRKVLKYGATRWLSKEACIQRVLQQYASLKSYFASQNASRSDLRLTRLKRYFEDPLTEIYLLFYQSVLPLFSEVNKFLQFEEPKIHIVRRELTGFIQKLFGRFLQVSAFKEIPVTDVNLQDPSNFLDDDKVMIGFTTRMAFNKHNLLPKEEQEVAQACRSFFVASLEYAMSHLPLADDLLKHAEVLQMANRETANFESILYFVERFPTLKAKLVDKMDKLYDQFTTYQLLPDSMVDSQQRVDKTWFSLGQLKQEDGIAKFDLLFEVAKHILVLPHSNAEEERVFSTVSKNKTKFRASLSNKTTLPSILTCKTNFFCKTPCHAFVPSKMILQKAKSAASAYNSDHSTAD